jgi:hypothetical protein
LRTNPLRHEGIVMRHLFLLVPFALALAGSVSIAAAFPEKEFLTDKEIAKIQDAQEIDERTRIYLNAAALRLKTAVERLTGTEPEPGDPLEFFTPEDLIDGYYRIIRSVMYNLDEASQKPKGEREKLGKALKSLKGSTENAGKELEILKRIAEEKQKEELWKLVNNAIDITNGAHEGAEYGLSKQPTPQEKNKKH